MSGKWPCSQSQVSKWQSYMQVLVTLVFMRHPSPNYSYRHTHTLNPQLLFLPCHHNSEVAQA